MKYIVHSIVALFLVVAPARGAWIEIEDDKQLAQNQKVAPARGAWIEISKLP